MAKNAIVYLVGIFLFSFSSLAVSSSYLKKCASIFTPEQQEDSFIEHMYGGVPDDSQMYIRRAYVFSYDDENKVPSWAAWHAHKSYRDTPTRKSRWSAFRQDPELKGVTTEDYTGWYNSKYNFARGHIVPFYISGGDRDHDGMDAEYETDLKVEDMDDACTVFEVNAMTNIAPQYHKQFNGSKGLWWQLETDIRSLIDEGREYQVFAGTVFIESEAVLKIGRRSDDDHEEKIGVPHGFFKVVVDPVREEAVGFLFDHQRDLANGCDIKRARWPSECVVSIETIENLTGLRFFAEFRESKNKKLRQASLSSTWKYWLNSHLD